MYETRSRQVGRGLIPFCDCPRYISMNELAKKLTSGFLVAGMALCLASVSAMAETVSQKHASKIAETFFNTAYGIHVAAPKLAWNGRQLTTDRLFTPFYVYNHSKGGFVIISAENKAFPVLGYSLDNTFSLDKLNDDVRDLLTRYARQIEIIRYDPRTPDRAVEAWQNLPDYITSVLKTPYDTPEYRELDPEEKEEIERLDRKNSWIVMPSAVEFNIYNHKDYRDYNLEDALAAEPEDVPFSFYENFIREIRNEEKMRLAAFDEVLMPAHPVLRDLGGAHFVVDLPEDARMLRVYGIDGSRKLEKYYSDTASVSIDISSLPVGYYVAMILTDSGHVYGLKLYRI